ncbi:hypothetical protein Tco_1205721, partial [Tanacetum coccineum]
MALPPREHRHRFLRYKGLEYSDADITDFEARLARIHRREGVSLFTSRAWRKLFDIRGPLVYELILEFYSTFRFGQVILDLDTPGTLQFQLGGARRRMSWREFILALGLHTNEEMQTAGFGGLTVISLELPIIDMAELVRLQICVEIVDTWAWVAMGRERQPDAAAGTPVGAEDAPAVDEGDQAISAPILEEDVYEIRRALTKQREVIDGMACDFSGFSTWVVTGLGQMMDRDLVKEILTNIGGEFTNLEDLEVLES